MKKITFLLVIFCSFSMLSQNFNGSSGGISDDGAYNYYTASVTGLSGNLNASLGLVQVCLNISHTYDSDLNVELIAPDGTTINLFSGVGGSGHNFFNTCLNMSAAMPINNASPPFTGTFKPQETIGNVNNGQNGNGQWQLRIHDTYPDADTGTVNSWSIYFASNASVPFVFTSSNLPIVIIDTDNVPIPDEPKIDGTMGIIDNGEGQINYITDAPNNFNGNIGIELRGNFSQGLPQKPYKFETRDAALAELNVSLLGMPEEHDWLLISNYNDKVFMRNTMAYSLFEQMGHYATRSKYCEVVLNGSYQGVYMLMENIKRDNNRVDIAKLLTTENTGINVTGGYIIKNDYWDSNNSWLLNYHPIDHPELDVHLVYDYPKPEDITVAQKSYVQTFINDLETALYSNNFSNPLTGYNKYLDTDSFVDYFIINELSRNNDGFKKSSYFNKDIDTPTAISKLKAGPVWDFDWAWKNIPECSIFAATDGSGWAHLINDCGPDVNSPGWYVRLLQDPVFCNKLKCRWTYFRSTILSDIAINNYIDANALLLNAAQARHFEKWGNLGLNTGTPEVEQDPDTFAEEITKFKDWIHLRVLWLDTNMPGDLTDCTLVVNDDNFYDNIGLYPNPTKDYLNFSNKSLSQKVNIEVFDSTGKSILKQESLIDGTILKVSTFANGIYTCKIFDGNSVLKIMKIAVVH